MNMLSQITKAIKNSPHRYQRPEIAFDSGSVREFQKYLHATLTGITDHYNRVWRDNKDRLYSQDSREVRDNFLTEIFMMELSDQCAMTRKFKQMFWKEYDQYINREIIHQAAVLFDRTNTFLLLIIDSKKGEEVMPVCHYKIATLLELMRGELVHDNLVFLAQTVAANKSTQIPFVRALPQMVKKQLLGMGDKAQAVTDGLPPSEARAG